MVSALVIGAEGLQSVLPWGHCQRTQMSTELRIRGRNIGCGDEQPYSEAAPTHRIWCVVGPRSEPAAEWGQLSLRFRCVALYIRPHLPVAKHVDVACCMSLFFEGTRFLPNLYMAYVVTDLITVLSGV